MKICMLQKEKQIKYVINTCIKLDVEMDSLVVGSKQMTVARQSCDILWRKTSHKILKRV